MITPSQLLAERRGTNGRVLVLTLSNPSARNALGPEVYRAGLSHLRSAEDDAGIGATVLTGAGEHFCAGGNLNRLQANRTKPQEAQAESIQAFHAWVAAITRSSKPVIAAVEGVAAGGGFSLALACDLMVAAEDARFVMSYVNIGLSPDGGGSFWLARALPRPVALEILLGGGTVSAARLQALGLVNRISRRGAALADALEWADTLARGPLHAMARIKRLVNLAPELGLAEHLEAELEGFLQGLYSDECAEGIAAFLEKRRPVWAHTLPAPDAERRNDPIEPMS